MTDSHLPPRARTPRSAVHAMKREAVYLEAFVALALVLCICALLYMLGFDAALGA